jgi:hypothetical protein
MLLLLHVVSNVSAGVRLEVLETACEAVVVKSLVMVVKTEVKAIAEGAPEMDKAHTKCYGSKD